MSRAVASLSRHAARRHQTSFAKRTHITTLPNNIRVATESTPGHFACVGLYVDAGARNETESTLGVSHFLDRMAFKATTSRSDVQMAQTVDNLGGQIICSSSRECVMYQSSHTHASTPLALSLIADTVLNPAFTSEDIEGQRDAAFYELRETTSKPELNLPEVLHHVAYGGATLGNSLLCPEDRIDKLDGDMLRACLKSWYRPERMVIAGAGVHHEELVELVDKYFSSLKATPQAYPPRPSPSILTHLPPPPGAPQSLSKTLARAASSYLSRLSASPRDPPHPLLHLEQRIPATYQGGSRFILDTSSELDHIYIAFEGVGIHDDDIFALATVQTLLGGGGSFSAGGPGKGMYSRLYTHILNHHPQIDHCASFHHIYKDSSLFGLFASAFPWGGGLTQILPHLVNELGLLLYTPVEEQELSRAKNQLKSNLIMALENRALEVEDLGRQVLIHNRRYDVAELCSHIDEVTPDAVVQVARRTFGPDSGQKATIVCMGKGDVGDWQPVFRRYGIAAQ